jgi:nitrous oxidase accessory protein NosD
MRADQQVQHASSLIGRTVTLKTETGDLVSGPVTGLNLETDAPRIVVHGQPYGLETVIGVAAPNRLF